ncbi:MAG TPA: UbiA family prenyltransferase, partial [Polyangiales bacterium]|nr:UbiA family prenyltransferase [Polyangiales bacterium]
MAAPAMLRDYLELSRPKDWVKNVFVLMPVPFAMANGAKLDVKLFLLGLLAFALANSAVYSFNDAQDAERDKAHEKKRERPVASGRVPLRGAYLWSVSLAGASAALAASIGSNGAL